MATDNLEKNDYAMDEMDEIDRNLRIMEVVETELERQKGEAIFCLTFFMCIISVWILLVALWDYRGRQLPGEIMTLGIELIAALMLLVILRFTRLDIHKMGVTKKNLKSALLRAAVICELLFVAMLAYKLITQPGQPIFNLAKFEITYAFTAILQEFLARGFLLTTLKNINTTKNGKHIAVLCSSLMFTSLHLYYGFTFMLGAGILSVILGYCYLKDENIWGISIVHFYFGTIGIMMELV